MSFNGLARIAFVISLGLLLMPEPTQKLDIKAKCGEQLIQIEDISAIAKKPEIKTISTAISDARFEIGGLMITPDLLSANPTEFPNFVRTAS